MRSCIVVLIGMILVGIYCSSRPRTSSHESVKIYRNGYSDEQKSPYMEEIHFVTGTSDPLNVKYYKKSALEEVLCKENKFYYKNGIIKRVDYYIYLKNEKIKVGKKLFFLDGLRPLKYEYYAIADLYDRNINLSGLDLYTYSENNSLDFRRIIEYAYDTTTGTRLQISQYLIKYEKEKPISVKASILDIVTKNIITQEETNPKVISEMLKNIEKGLIDRAQGVMYLQDECK
ncbi:MAG: hypothetical protein N2316_05910 [Spirochaetes bacterium]|nr:hypothetical protein [Spirochaetota bacterium]